jgi:hypothetical protein
MWTNRLFPLALMTGVMFCPIVGPLNSSTVLAESAVQRPLFQGIRFSSAGMTTSIRGDAETTVTLFIQNYDANKRTFTSLEWASLNNITLIDAQQKQYSTQLEGNLNAPFFYGENRSIKVRITHPMGIYPRALKLDSLDPKKPIYIRL